MEITLGEVYERFKSVRALKATTLHVYEHAMNNYFSDWLSKPVVGITKDMVEKRFDKILNSGGPRTTDGKAKTHQAMRTLRAVLNFAGAVCEDDQGRSLLPENPTKRLSQAQIWKKAKPKARYNTIKPTQLEAWAKAVFSLDNETVRDFLLLTLFTGLRREEAAGLMWSEINFDERILHLPAERVKTDQPHTLPLSSFVFDLLKRRRNDLQNRKLASIGSDPFVFPGTGVSGRLVEPKGAIQKVKKESGVDFIVHDLRRTFGTVAEQLDISHYKVKRLLNHSVAADVTASHYIQIDVEQLREPMQKISDYFIEHGKIAGLSLKQKISAPA